MMDKRKLVEVFQKFLDMQNYDLCLTITFRNKTGLELAKKQFKYFFKYLNTKEEMIFDSFFIGWVFFEKENRGGVHIHAIISGISPSKASILEKRCRDYFGESKVVPYDLSRPTHKSMSRYLAEKYVTDDLEFFDFMRINSRIRYRDKVYLQHT